MAETKPKRVLQITKLDVQNAEHDYARHTPAERIGMVWPLTVAAWTFKDGSFTESRLQRHIVRLQRRAG